MSKCKAVLDSRKVNVLRVKSKKEAVVAMKASKKTKTASEE